MKRYQNQKVVVESGNSFLTLLLILFIGLKLGKVIGIKPDSFCIFDDDEFDLGDQKFFKPVEG